MTTLLTPADLNWSLNRGVNREAARGSFAHLSEDISATVRSIEHNNEVGAGSVWMQLEDESERIQRTAVELILQTFLDRNVVRWFVEHESHIRDVQHYLRYLKVTAERVATINSKLSLTATLTEHQDHTGGDRRVASGGPPPLSQRKFDVALSFPGEKRPFVASVAAALRDAGIEVFYDDFFEADLAQPNLDVLLQTIYHDNSRLIVVFVCADCENKEWCGLEWRAVRDLIKRRRTETIMLMRFDDIEMPGLFSIDGHVDLRKRTPHEASGLIQSRLCTS